MAIGVLSQLPSVLPDDMAAEQARSQFWQPGVLSQQNPGALSQQVMAQPAPTMPKPTWIDYVGDVALPLLATLATGGFGAPAAFAYGLSAMQARKRMADDPLANAKYQAAGAKANFEAANPDIAFPAGMNIPAEIQVDRYMQNDPRYLDRLRQRRQAGGVVRQYTDAQGNVVGVFADGSQVLMGPSMDSPTGYQRQRDQAGAVAGAQEGARIGAQTAPGAVAAQADAAATIGGAKAGAEKAATDKAGTLNAMVDAVTSQQNAVAALDDAIAAVERGPETNAVSGWVSLIDPQLQVLEGALNAQALSNYSTARASGMTGQMSDREMQFIRSIGGQLTNNKQANLQILKAQRDKLLRNIESNRKSYSDYQKNAIRPLPEPYAPKRPPLSSFGAP